MPTTSVELPADLKREIEAAVETGPYTSNSDLIRDAVRRLLDRRSERLSTAAINALQHRLEYDETDLIDPDTVERG